MNKFNPHLKLTTILVLVLSMGFLSFTHPYETLAEQSGLSNSNINVLTEVIDQNNIGTMSNNQVVPNLNTSKTERARESASKMAYIINGFDRTINNQLSQLSNQVPTVPTVENLCNGEITANVATASELNNKLSDNTTKCIKLTANININLKYSVSNNPASPNVSLLKDKVIFNDANNKISIETSSENLTINKKTYINGGLKNLIIFNTEINYTSPTGNSNLILFSNLNNLELINTIIKSTNPYSTSDYNHNPLIGSENSPIVNLYMYSNSLISSVVTGYSVINAGNINILYGSTITATTSGASAISVSDSLNVVGSSVTAESNRVGISIGNNLTIVDNLGTKSSLKSTSTTSNRGLYVRGNLMSTNSDIDVLSNGGVAIAVDGSVNISGSSANSIVKAITTSENAFIVGESFTINNTTLTATTTSKSAIITTGDFSISNDSIVNVSATYLTSDGSSIETGGNFSVINSMITTSVHSVINVIFNSIKIDGRLNVESSNITLTLNGNSIVSPMSYGFVVKGGSGATNSPSMSTIGGNSTISISKDNASTNTLVGIYLPQSNNHLSISNSTINSVVNSNSIKSSGSQNSVSLRNGTTFNHTGTSTAIHIGEANENATLTIDNAKLQMKMNASAFIGHNLVLSNGGKILQDASVTYTNTNPYVRTNSLIMNQGSHTNRSEIILKTVEFSFLSGLGNTKTDVSLKNANIVVKYTSNIAYVPLVTPTTSYVANVNNLTLDNSDVKIEHHGDRVLITGYLDLKSVNTLGFAEISGNVNILGGTNLLSLKQFTNNGSVETYFSGGFVSTNEHTFIKMTNNGTFNIANSTVTYDSNVSLLSTNKEIAFEMTNSSLNAIMALPSVQMPSHSFISVRDGVGKIDLEMDKSVLQIVHKSDYVYNSSNISNSTKPTISLFDHVGLGDSALPNINLSANDSTFSVRDITVSNFTTFDANNAAVMEQKLSPSAIPLEINSIELTNNSNFSYYNNHALYPLIRSKDFKAINSNVTFEKSGVYHVNSSNDSSLPSTSNYSHIMYDMIADTKFSFLLDSSASNYKGAQMKFLTSSNRNVLNKYLITNGNSNITAKIEYFNITTYGGSDSGKEFNRALLFDSVDKGTTILTGTSSLNIARNQTEVSSQMSKYNLNPTLSSPVLESTSNVFDVSINRRKNIIIGDFYVEFDSILEYDSATEKSYIIGYATPGTVITNGSNPVTFDQTLEPNGLAKFRYEYSESESVAYTFKASFRVKEGGALNNQSDNAPDLNFTRYYSVQPSLGELKLTTVGNLNFGNKTLNSQSSYLDRITGTNFEINISDTRRNSPGWVLELCVVSEFKTTLNQNQLSMFNNLSYKDSNNTYHDLRDGCVDKVVVARSATDNVLNKTITWQHNQGLQLHITNPWLIISGNEYTATVKFTLYSSDAYVPVGP